MKRYLSKIVRGEYVSSPILNFISSSLKEVQDSFNSFIVLRPGILAERLTVDTYSDALYVDLNQSTRQVSIRPGSFIDRYGIVTNIFSTLYPFTIDQSLWGQDLRVYIRRFDTDVNPGTLTFTANTQNVTGLNTDFLEYLEPGMSIEIVPDPNFPSLTGVFEVTGVTSNTSITVTPLPPVSGNGLQFKVRARFLDGVVIPIPSLYPYRFSRYIIDYRLPTDPVSQDDILLANLNFDDDTSFYEVENIRDDSNVAKLFTGISEELESQIVNFFINGYLQLGDGPNVDIYGNSHPQNTDLGSTSSIFQLGFGSENILEFQTILDANIDYVCSVQNIQPVSRNLILPSIRQSPLDSNYIRIAALDTYQKFSKAQLVNRSLTSCMIVNDSITVTEEGNIFSVSGSGTPNIRRILVEINGVVSSLDVSQAEGFCITLWANEPFILNPQNNSNIDLSAPLSVQSNEFVTLIVLGSTWKVISSSWLTNELLQITQQVQGISDLINSWDIPGLQATVDQISITLASLIDQFDQVSQQLNITIASVQADIQTLQDTVEAMVLMPVGSIAMLSLKDVEVSNYFDASGKGLQNQRFNHFAICNGNNGTPNLTGRIPVMFNQLHSSPVQGESSSDSPSTTPGTSSNSIQFPTFDLDSPVHGQWDKRLDISQLPVHNHRYSNHSGGRVLVGFNSYEEKSDNSGWRSGNSGGRPIALRSVSSTYPEEPTATMSTGGSTGVGIFPATYTLLFIMRIE